MDTKVKLFVSKGPGRTLHSRPPWSIHLKQVALWLAVIFTSPVSASLGPTISYENNDYKEIVAALQHLKATYPDWVTLHTAGNSTFGLPILYATIHRESDQSIANSYRKSFLLVGGHHGNERPAVQAVVEFMRVVLEPRNRPWLLEMTSRTDFHLLPCINPDGFATGLRMQSQGLDINRDYPYPGRRNLALRAKETRQLVALLDELNVTETITLHSGIEAVLWPFGYTDAEPRGPVGERLPALARAVGRAMGIERVIPMYQSYPTFGAYIDYAFITKGISALNIELSEDHSPPPSQMPLVLARSNWGVFAYLNEIHGLVSDDMPIDRSDAAGDPLVLYPISYSLP